MASKITYKQALMRLGLADTAQEAEKLILSRKVLCKGQVVRFAGDKISEENLGEIALSEEKKYFSRAGQKLEHGLTEFQVDVKDKICADVGASTGGFTGVLLSSGAKKVYAIDVARGEIAWKLRTDPAVVLMERTNARDLKELPEPIDFVSIDVSFISVEKILPNVKNWLTQEGKCVVLVKPQFEAPKDLVGEGGIITDPDTHKLVIENFLKHAEQAGFTVNGFCDSPIQGMHGNKEFLALLSPS